MLKNLKIFAWVALINVPFLFATTSPASPLSPKTCVLVFERPGNPITQGVLNVFENYPNASIKIAALPTDILQCINQGASELLIVAHAVEIRELGESRLGYFIQQDSSMNTSEPVGYRLGLFTNHIFESATSILAEQNLKGIKKLSKIRLMSCDPQGILKAYPKLHEMLEKNHITLDSAPTSPFLSTFSDIPITRFNTQWLAEDIDCSEMNAWRTDKNNWCENDSWPGCDRKKSDYCLPASSR